jgi:urease subunit gamma/beta
MDLGKRILGINDVMPNVAHLIDEVQVEGTFPDGSKLVTVHDPICNEYGDESLALHGSGLTRSPPTLPASAATTNKPGEMLCAEGDIVINEGRETISIQVVNRGDRPVQVGSHYPFFEANPALDFDREKTFGFRLNIPSGAAVRFEPGESKQVELVEISGERKVFGAHGIISGPITDENKAAALVRAKEKGFKGA